MDKFEKELFHRRMDIMTYAVPGDKQRVVLITNDEEIIYEDEWITPEPKWG